MRHCVYNRLPWNFTGGNGQVAYANNYQVTNSSDALEIYRQCHVDAWGHYLTAMKMCYVLRDGSRRIAMFSPSSTSSDAS